MGLGLRLLAGIAHNVAAWPEATIGITRFPGWGLALVAFGLALCGLWRGRLRLSGFLPIAAGLAAPLFLTPPDLLVGPEARLIALHTNGRILVNRAPGVTAFEAAAPDRLWGSVPMLAFEGQPAAACTPQACRVDVSGRVIQIVRDEAALDCSAALVVSPLWLRGGCPHTPVLDHEAAMRDGATEASLSGGGINITTDRALRGARPWVLLELPGLPMALTE